MSDLVFVDTCVWAAFFTKAASAEKKEVDNLLDADRIAIVGPILAEVLIGFRRADQANWVASRLKLCHYIELTWSDWRAAAKLGSALASHGHTLPLTDLIVAATAKRLAASVYTTDPHFDLISDLKRHTVALP